MKIFNSLTLLAILLGASTLNSCKKSNSNPTPAVTNTITVTVDGTATNFNVGAKAGKLTNSGETLTSITGTSVSGAIISITLAGTVTAGKTYADNAASDNDKPLFIYATSSSQTADDFINDDDIATSLPTVTITAISGTSIQGTFSGNITNTLLVVGTPASGTVKSLTGGKFNVSF